MASYQSKTLLMNKAILKIAQRFGATLYYELGIQLDIRDYELENIKTDHPNNCTWAAFCMLMLCYNSMGNKIIPKLYSSFKTLGYLEQYEKFIRDENLYVLMS